MYGYLTMKLKSGDFSYLRNLHDALDHRYIVDAINHNPLLAIRHIPMNINLIGHALHVYFLFHYPNRDEDAINLDIHSLADMVDYNKKAFINNIEFGVLIAENFVMGSYAPNEVLETLCEVLCPGNALWLYTNILDSSDELKCLLGSY